MRKKKIMKQQLLSLCLLLIFFISSALISRVVQGDSENYLPVDLFTEASESKIVDLKDISKTPSLSVGIIYQDEIVYMNAFGEQSHIT